MPARPRPQPGDPVQVDYPSPDCPQPDGLQGCIDRVDPGSTIRVTTEIVGESISITKAIRLLGAPDLQPQLDRIDVTGTTAVIDVTLRDLRVLGGIWVVLGTTDGHAVRIEHVTVKGSIPNTGSAITMQTTVPATFILERSAITGGAPGRDSVSLSGTITHGSTLFRLVGNRISQHGKSGSAGAFVRHSDAGTNHVQVLNNRIWDVGRCGCGINSGIVVAVAGAAHVDAAIVGNTIERSAGAGIMIRNDLEGAGSFTADVFNNVVAHTQGDGIARDSAVGTTTPVRNGFNAFFETDSAPTDRFLGPGTRFVDPRFVNRASGDLRLKASSPLIDRGLVCSPGGVADPDAAGRHRLAGPTVDIGAYEVGAEAPTGIVVVDDAGSRLIRGTAGADILCGDGGADALYGAGGPDFLDGGAGTDRLIGGGGRDRLFGRGGADHLCAKDGRGVDHLDGGPSIDRFEADTGDTRISVETRDSCDFG